ncbi:MAG: replication restart helicase PriA [Lachnospiraceae bacterium]
MTPQYASVIVDISHENVDRTFQYRIPEALLSEIRIGTLVSIPFGTGNRTRKGYVVDITDKTEYDQNKIKEIAGVVSKSITAGSQLIQLAWWMKEQYGSTMNQAMKTVLPVKRQIKTRNKEVVQTLLGSQHPAGGDKLVLNQEQQWIADAFSRDWREGNRIPYLIHGVTGSGKTEVYMAMMDEVLKQGRQVIVLIPEISLTYQTVMRFYQRYGDRISVMHSRLSAGERYDQFKRASNGETDIMIGPRSALFTPFSSLGLVVIDEEQEGAYKSEVTPRYHAREVAQQLVKMNDAHLVLGSATPSVEAYTMAQEGQYQLFELTRRAGDGSHLAETEVIDLREEMKRGNKSIFSERLQGLIADRLEKKEQIILFMNRRGYSSFVSCRSCGEAVKCPHCDVSLTLHNRTRLVCHYCGYNIPMPKHCPGCSSPYLAGFGVGTQKIEEMTRQMYPKARVLRMDFDTTSRKGGHESILSAFSKGEADILIGTQMIVKGHDFPKVTLVGILAADVSLYAPDYRCAERTFQLLVQAAGRAGRGRRPGIAVIQTYMPEHYSIQASASQNYEAFYQQEMGFRKLMHYPPACHLLTIQVAGKDEERLETVVQKVKAVAEQGQEAAAIIGPVPASVYKVNDIYRKIIYLKHQNYDILIRIQKRLQVFWDELEESRANTIQYDFS